MAQYLISVLTDATEGSPPAVDAAIDVFNEQLRAKGHWVFANGLAAPSTATVVDGRHEEPVFTDGPYVESKEWLIIRDWEARLLRPATAMTGGSRRPS